MRTTFPGSLSLRHGAWQLGCILFAVLWLAAPAAQAAVTEAWVQRYSMGAFADSARAVAVDRSGNVAVTGLSYSSVTEVQAYTAKYAAVDGALLWEKRYAGLGVGSTGGMVVAFDNDGNVLVLGRYDNGSPFRKFVTYLAKYAAADGSLMWERHHMTAEETFDTGYGGELGLAVDASNNVVVTGGKGTAKYAAATGALVWEKQIKSGTNGATRPIALALDADGNVVVTGHSRNRSGLTNDDFYTVKYAAADGHVLWEAFYNSPADSSDEAVAVAVDASGNVVVTGRSGVEGDPASYTAKYAAADGALIWERLDRRYDTNGLVAVFYPADVAVDAAGNAFVTGSRFDSEGLWVVYTVKYDAADGALLWERIFQGAESAVAIALDSRGGVVVAGGVYGAYVTAAFASEDGRLIWQQRYAGPQSVENYLWGRHSLATGPGGMVAVAGTSDNDFATVVYHERPRPGSFADWAAGFGLTPAAATGDADGDGLPGAVEFVLGEDPSVPAAADGPTGTVNGDHWLFTFRRDDASETPDVRVEVEAGANLVTWPDVFTIGPDTARSSQGITITENGPAMDTITVSIPRVGGMPRFARLKVAIAP